jgi:hypothetical protein
MRLRDTDGAGPDRSGRLHHEVTNSRALCAIARKRGLALPSPRAAFGATACALRTFAATLACDLRVSAFWQRPHDGWRPAAVRTRAARPARRIGG